MNAPKVTKWTLELISQTRALWEEGANINEIVAATGISSDRVRSQACKRKWRRPDRRLLNARMICADCGEPCYALRCRSCSVKRGLLNSPIEMRHSEWQHDEHGLVRTVEGVE